MHIDYFIIVQLEKLKLHQLKLYLQCLEIKIY